MTFSKSKFNDAKTQEKYFLSRKKTNFISDMRSFAGLFILILLISATNIFAQQRLSNYEITAGAGLTGNLYSSQFKQLPDVPNCCNEFTSAFGIGWSFNAGMEYLLNRKLFDKPLRYSVGLSLVNQSANYSVEEFIGHNINGNEYTKILVDHKLNPTLTTLSLDNSLMINPFDDIPLSVSLGFSIGTFMQKDYEQSENLKSPDNITFENGKRVRKEFNGTIKNTSLQISAIAGAKYRVWQSDLFSVYANIGYRHGFTNVAKELDWKISSISAGLSANYSIPLPEQPKPKSPPPPPLPPPPPPAMPEIALALTYQGKTIEDGATINIPVTNVEYFVKRYVLPVIFFNENTTDMTENTDANKTSPISAQYSVIESVGSYLVSNPQTNVTLNGYVIDGDDADIAAKRIEHVSKMLESKGIDKSRITSDIHSVSGKKLPYPELKEEWHRVTLVFSDNAKIIPYSIPVRSEKRYESAEFYAKPMIKAEAGVKKFEGNTLLNSNKISDLAKDGTTINLTAENVKTAFGNSTSPVLDIRAAVEDIAGNKVGAVSKLKLAEKNNAPQYLEETEAGNSLVPMPLGFCEFDRSSFYAINNITLDKIRAALTEGKTVEIFALTDKFGTEDYNTQLAAERAENAIKLIGIKSGNLIISETKDLGIPGNSPSGRMLNRGVWAKIIDNSK